ncbi:MAG TPA: MATE family efflux transporter [Dehalococcoidia bacterium]|nr:MATE family efflux transporter [Dehalococcoidia bacterium]
MFKLTIPAFMGMFVMTLYNVIDTIFIGHYVGTMGIAGLSIVFPIQMLAMGMGMLTGMGGASVISRLIGAKNVTRAERALGNALCLNIALSTIIMVAGLSAAEFWLDLVGASDTILPYALDYMTFILVGMVFQTFSMASNGLITSEGNARVAMTGMVIGAGSNIVLDALLIIPLDMGIKGAAIATTIAHLISALYFISYWMRGKSYLRLHLNNFILEWGIIKEIMFIGVSALARTLAGSLSAIFVNRALVEYGGDYAISTFGILNRVMMFATMPGMVIGHGLQPILGYNFGAKRYSLALKGIIIAMTLSTSWCIIAFFLLYFIPAPFVRIFSSDSDLIGMASSASRNIFLVLYLMGLVFTGSMVFVAIGKAKEAFITSITQRALFLVPLVFILPPVLDLDGVWLSFPISDGLSFVLTFALLVPVWRQFRRLGDQSQETVGISEKILRTYDDGD